MAAISFLLLSLLVPYSIADSCSNFAIANGTIFLKNLNIETSLKWLTVAMPLLENSKKQERDKTRVTLERDQREIREKLERYGAM